MGGEAGASLQFECTITTTDFLLSSIAVTEAAVKSVSLVIDPLLVSIRASANEGWLDEAAR